MTHHDPTTRERRGGRLGRLGFTLIELLVVMAIIVIIGTIVLIAFRGIAKEARLSSGTNTIISALGNARALAMRSNRLVMVVFRPRLLDENTQVIEVVTAQWSRQTQVFKLDPLNSSTWTVIDRFEPVQDIPVRRIARGIKVAGPLYAESDAPVAVGAGVTAGDRDSFWATQAQLTAIDQSNPTSNASEPPGQLIGVMFSPEGAVVDANMQSDADGAFIDQNNDGLQQINGMGYDLITIAPGGHPVVDHFLDVDEPIIRLVPYLAVFDDEEFRELFQVVDWRTDVNRYERDLRLYFTENANPIHFNSYTGVAMR